MTAITTAVRLLREAADELKNAHTLGGDWGDEHEALDAYNEHMATATTLEHMARQCLAQIEEPAQPIAGYRISDPSDPTIKPWLSETPDDNGYRSEPLYAGAAPAAVAGPAIDRAATLAAIDDISEPSWTGYECPNTWADGLSAARAVVQSAPAARALAAPALEAPAAPVGSARQFIEWMYSQPEDREPTTAEGALLEFEAHLAAAAPQAPAAPAVDAWLQPDDMAALQRFHETAEDDESYDIGKEAVARLCAFGCLQSHSFGRYSTTDFGDYLLDTWAGARTLPFTTAAERDARAAQAAAKGEHAA